MDSSDPWQSGEKSSRSDKRDEGEGSLVGLWGYAYVKTKAKGGPVFNITRTTMYFLFVNLLLFKLVFD